MLQRALWHSNIILFISVTRTGSAASGNIPPPSQSSPLLLLAHGDPPFSLTVPSVVLMEDLPESRPSSNKGPLFLTRQRSFRVLDSSIILCTSWVLNPLPPSSPLLRNRTRTSFHGCSDLASVAGLALFALVLLWCCMLSKSLILSLIVPLPSWTGL